MTARSGVSTAAHAAAPTCIDNCRSCANASALGELPTVDGVIPVVVTFHDINRYTARHMQEYLQILLDSAQVTGVKTAADAVLHRPWCDSNGQRCHAPRRLSVRKWHLPGRVELGCGAPTPTDLKPCEEQKCGRGPCSRWRWISQSY